MVSNLDITHNNDTSCTAISKSLVFTCTFTYETYDPSTKRETEKEKKARKNKEHISNMIRNWFCPAKIGEVINRNKAKLYVEIGYSKSG